MADSCPFGSWSNSANEETHKFNEELSQLARLPMADSDDSSSFKSNIANKESQKSNMQVTIPGLETLPMADSDSDSDSSSFQSNIDKQESQKSNKQLTIPGLETLPMADSDSDSDWSSWSSFQSNIDNQEIQKSNKQLTIPGLETLPVADSDSDSDCSSFQNNIDDQEIQKSNKQLTIPEGKWIEACLSDYENKGIVGTPLAHVFSISINPDIEKCELYGKIWVEDDMGIVDYLFNLEREEPKLVFHQSSGNSLLLVQTNRAILATDYFKVHFHLKSGDSDLLKESFCWYGNTVEDYDKLLCETIVGEGGSATVSYIVHSAAIEGHIVPRFNKSDTGSSSVRIKGTIIARYRNIDPSDGVLEEYSQVKILEGVVGEVNDMETFAIDKSVLAIPIYFPLVIEVDLYEDEGGRALWKKKVKFSIKEIMDRVEKNIPGSNGCLSLHFLAINYSGDLQFFNLEKRKAMWRKNGLIIFRWSYEDYIDSSIDED